MSNTAGAEKEDGVRFSFWLEGDEQAEYRIAAFKVEEALFSLTKIEILLKISSSSLSFADRLGKKGSLCLRAEGLAKPTYFSGIVAEATEFFEAGEVLTRLALLPRLAKLEKEPRYRVFQELTVPDIVETILCEHGIADALWQLEGNFVPRRFCMQYGESDLAFMRRILAEEGIFYYFIHAEKGGQQPVLCNAVGLLPECPNGGALKHDSHDCHGLYDVAGAAEIYCHSLRRSYGAGAAQSERRKTGSPPAARLYEAADRPSGISLAGIAHLPLPLCGHKVALQCPFDKSLNALWTLTAVRHEGIGADSSLLSRDLAEYFAEGMEALSESYAESVAADGSYGRAFGTASLLPRLCQANGGFVYADEAAASAYGAPRSGRAASGLAHNVVPMQHGAYGQNSGRQRQSGAAARKAVYACAWTAVDRQAVYKPPISAKPIIAGPQEAQIIHVDAAARRYKLALQISPGGCRQAEELRFWAYADTELGAAVAGFAADWAAGGSSGAERAAQKLIVEFLGGNPDKPIMLRRDRIGSGAAEAALAPRRREMQGEIPYSPAYAAAAPHTLRGAESAGLDEAEFEEQIKQVLDSMPWNGGSGRPNAAYGQTAAYGENPGGAPLYAGKAAPESAGLSAHGRYAAADRAKDADFIGRSARETPAKPIPLAQIQADLQNSAAQDRTWSPYRRAAPQTSERGSRFLEVLEHQREDIHGIYELNCGEKYLCKTKAMHINAADRLILRGPGGKIIIDKYSMILEAPLIRLKGKLSVEDSVFDRQDGVKIAIRDELPLVADCSGDETGQ